MASHGPSGRRAEPVGRLEGLIDEVLGEILAFLDECDLVSLRSCSRILYAKVSDGGAVSSFQEPVGRVRWGKALLERAFGREWGSRRQAYRFRGIVARDELGSIAIGPSALLGGMSRVPTSLRAFRLEALGVEALPCDRQAREHLPLPRMSQSAGSEDGDDDAPRVYYPLLRAQCSVRRAGTLGGNRSILSNHSLPTLAEPRLLAGSVLATIAWVDESRALLAQLGALRCVLDGLWSRARRIGRKSVGEEGEEDRSEKGREGKGSESGGSVEEENMKREVQKALEECDRIWDEIPNLFPSKIAKTLSFQRPSPPPFLPHIPPSRALSLSFTLLPTLISLSTKTSALVARIATGLRRALREARRVPPRPQLVVTPPQRHVRSGSIPVAAVPSPVSYFEVAIEAPRSSGEEEGKRGGGGDGGRGGRGEDAASAPCVAVGLSDGALPVGEAMPGWDALSFGWHGDDGKVFNASGAGRKFGPSFGPGDVVGCGLDVSRCLPTAGTTPPRILAPTTTPAEKMMAAAVSVTHRCGFDTLAAGLARDIESAIQMRRVDGDTGSGGGEGGDGEEEDGDGDGGVDRSDSSTRGGEKRGIVASGEEADGGVGSGFEAAVEPLLCRYTRAALPHASLLGDCGTPAWNPQDAAIFFTHNGRIVGSAFRNVDARLRWFPCVGLDVDSPARYNPGPLPPPYVDRITPRMWKFPCVAYAGALWQALARAERRRSHHSLIHRDIRPRVISLSPTEPVVFPRSPSPSPRLSPPIQDSLAGLNLSAPSPPELRRPSHHSYSTSSDHHPASKPSPIHPHALPTPTSPKPPHPPLSSSSATSPSSSSSGLDRPVAWTQEAADVAAASLAAAQALRSAVRDVATEAVSALSRAWGIGVSQGFVLCHQRASLSLSPHPLPSPKRSLRPPTYSCSSSSENSAGGQHEEQDGVWWERQWLRRRGAKRLRARLFAAEAAQSRHGRRRLADGPLDERTPARVAALASMSTKSRSILTSTRPPDDDGPDEDETPTPPPLHHHLPTSLQAPSLSTSSSSSTHHHSLSTSHVARVLRREQARLREVEDEEEETWGRGRLTGHDPTTDRRARARARARARVRAHIAPLSEALARVSDSASRAFRAMEEALLDEGEVSRRSHEDDSEEEGSGDGVSPQLRKHWQQTLYASLAPPTRTHRRTSTQ